MRYEHNCMSCVPFGEFDEYDLYLCPVNEEIVARFSNDPNGYLANYHSLILPYDNENHVSLIMDENELRLLIQLDGKTRMRIYPQQKGSNAN